MNNGRLLSTAAPDSHYCSPDAHHIQCTTLNRKKTHIKEWPHFYRAKSSVIANLQIHDDNVCDNDDLDDRRVAATVTMITDGISAPLYPQCLTPPPAWPRLASQRLSIVAYRL